MAKKRTREEPQPQNEGGHDIQNKTSNAAREDEVSRRDGMAAIARRRAAHFANFDEEADVTDGNVHVGSDKARTLGPWSSAMELVSAREKAQQDRQTKLQRQQQQQLGDGGVAEDGHDVVADVASWQPRRDPSLGPHPRNRVQPLFDHCLGVLTEYIDCVESLWGVPDTIKVRLAACVSGRRKMSAEAARLFSAAAPSELLLPDCTQLDAAVMGELAREVGTRKLQRLELGFCGRGFGDKAAAALTASGPLPELEVLALEGAYRLSDAGLLKLLPAAPKLTWLAVPQCPRLTGALLDRLPDLLPELSHLNLSDCRGVGGDSLVATLPRLRNLRTLKLDLIPEVDDTVLTAVGALPRLRELSIRCCQAVTDDGLTALAATRGSDLEVLRLDECGGKVTDRGLEAVASQCKALRVFSARRCTRLGDEALAELLRRGTVRHLTLSGVTGAGTAVAGALASCCRDSLEHLDVSFCRKLPDRSMGLLLDRCSRLRRLVVFGCSQLTARSLYGHNNSELVIEGMHTKVDLDLGKGRAGGGAGAAEGGGVSPPGGAEEEAAKRDGEAGAGGRRKRRRGSGEAEA